MSVVRKTAGVVGAAAVLWATSAGVASAHVTVSSPGATQGGYGVLVFRVPTESATASTIGLKVALPMDTPMTYVGVQPKVGWKYAVVKTKLTTPIQSEDGPINEVISEVDWTSTAAGIAPGEFDQFQLQVGPFPAKPTLTFRAVQHYSDNKDVSWIELPAAGSTTVPEHPAPHLDLAAAASSSAPATGAVASAPASAADPTSGVTVSAEPAQVAASNAASKGSVTTALVIGILGVLLGAGGVAVGMSGRRRAQAR